MPWHRKDDVFVEVDAPSASKQSFCALRKKYGFVLGVENDAAIGFFHDFKQLLDKHVINGKLNVTSGDRRNPHCMCVIDEILAFLASDLGHEQTHINLEITPVSYTHLTLPTKA